MPKLRPGATSLVTAALVVTLGTVVLFVVGSPAAPYAATVACLGWGASAVPLSPFRGSHPARPGLSAGSLLRVELLQLRSRQEQMRAQGHRNLIPESLMCPDTDVHEFVHLSTGRAKTASAGGEFRTCIGMLRVAGFPACMRVDVSEDFLLDEGVVIARSQTDDVVKEFSKAKAIVV